MSVLHEKMNYFLNDKNIINLVASHNNYRNCYFINVTHTIKKSIFAIIFIQNTLL